MPPYNSPKYKGGFCYVRLLTKRKHECKQCQKEYAKCQQLHKRNMNLVFLMFSLFHSITPILFRMRSTHPVTRLLFRDYNTSFDAPQQYSSSHIKRIPEPLIPLYYMFYIHTVQTESSDSGNSISSFIFTKPYFSYKGRPMAVASKETDVIPLHLISQISLSSVLYAMPLLL